MRPWYTLSVLDLYAVWRLDVDCAKQDGDCAGPSCYYVVTDSPAHLPSLDFHPYIRVYCLHKMELVALVRDPKGFRETWDSPDGQLHDQTTEAKLLGGCRLVS